MDDPFIGLELLNYKLVQFLDEGTFGKVYRAEHLYLPKIAAIKILRVELASEEIVSDFLKEARDLSRLTHKHIVQVIDCGFFELKGKKIPYLVMPLTMGSLKEKFTIGSILDMKTILTYVKGTAEALCYAHYTEKLVHRDIKPANLLLDKNGDVLVSDFGLAIVAHSINSLTPQEPLGSPAYMAPEQWDGEAIPASDQYALAICVYQWLSGDVPFHYTKELSIRKQHKQNTPPPLVRPGSPVTKEVQQVIMKALAKSPKHRYASVLDFSTALERAYFVSLPPEPKPLPPPPVPKLPQNKNRSRWLLIGVPIALIALLVTGVIFAVLAKPIGATTGTMVTITPAHQTVSNSFMIAAVTGTPDPTAHQVQARIMSYTSPSQSASANVTGSITGANAMGTLIFANIGNGVQIQGGILTGADGVQVSFGSVFLPFGSSTVQGTAVNQGTRGNIPALDINGSCCGDSNVRVRNPDSFSGGRDPIPNSIITQNDINSASNNLISTLGPSAQTALQQKVQVNEQVVSGSLKCTFNVTADHRVGDQAKSVKVTGTVTCTEEAYDQKAALDIAITALKAEAVKNSSAEFALVGNVVTSITSATVVDVKNTVSLVILAQGEWVYQLTDAILTGIKNKIAKESQSAAQADLLKTPGVLSATISISSGTTMPDAANISIKVVNIPGISGSPTPGSGSPMTTPSGTTPTSSPAITPTNGLGNGPTATPTVLGGS